MSIHRNDPCSCGSGRKYKQCCMKAAAPAGTANRSRALSAGSNQPAGLITALRGAADQRLQEGRYTEAVVLLRQLLERDPKDNKATFALGAALSRSGDAKEGLDHLQRAVAGNRRDASMRTELGHALFRLDRYREALAEADQAIALGDDSIHPRMLRAIALERLRQFGKARETIDRVLAMAPSHADAIIVKARLQRRSGDAVGGISALRSIAAETESAEMRYRALHELGMVLDATAHFDDAFDAFVASGRARRLTDEWTRFPLNVYPTLVTGYAEALARWPNLPPIDSRELRDATPAPSFLVGFPRSGTTLAEQMLAAHPYIATLEERPAIAIVRSEMVGGSSSPSAIANALAALTCDGAIELRRRYWQVVQSYGAVPDPPRQLLDKLPLNIVELPLIARIFPESKILVALRDPRDVCLSCFMQDFRLNEAMVHFLDWPATASLFVAVMRGWVQARKVLTNPWFEFRYEDVVTDVEPILRSILGVLQLPWHSAVLDFGAHAQRREIRTPSFQAVAGRIVKSAVGRHRHYATQIGRIEPLLRPIMADLGYIQGMYEGGRGGDCQGA